MTGGQFLIQQDALLRLVIHQIFYENRSSHLSLNGLVTWAVFGVQMLNASKELRVDQSLL